MRYPPGPLLRTAHGLGLRLHPRDEVRQARHLEVRARPVDQSTGVARFRVAAGHYVVFTGDLQHGDKVIVLHFTVKPTASSTVPCVA
jgi:predicted RNA-binding protein with TRAM domain